MVSVKQLGLLALKTFSDTIANGLKREAGCPPKIRQLAINLGQANHRLITRMERNLYDRPTNVPIHPLDEEKAVKVAGAILAELSVYSSVAGAAAIFTARRKEEIKKAKAEEARNDELQGIKKELAGEIAFHVEKQVEQQVDEIIQLAKFAVIIKLMHIHGHASDDRKARSN